MYLGRVDYATGLELQQTIVHLVKEGRIGHTLLLLEHPPVITLGRNAGMQNIVASREFLTSQGVELFETNRGGDVTFHGPGQLVGYPIFDLRAFAPRIGAVDFVRKLEETLIRTCGDLGVPTQRVPGLTGVWTQQRQQSAKHGEDRGHRRAYFPCRYVSWIRAERQHQPGLFQDDSSVRHLR